jgi:hypothetical protein
MGSPLRLPDLLDGRQIHQVIRCAKTMMLFG